jgi:uncharacterized protein
MIVVLAGNTGFVGSALEKELRRQGMTIRPVGRKEFSGGKDALKAIVKGADAVINLSGSPIAVRWTTGNTAEIRNSRLQTTSMLAEAIMASDRPPEVFISASASGIYDSAGIHDEYSKNFAMDFPGVMCREWEAKASAVGGITRLVILRTGIVLGQDGGALKKMLPVFRAGMGGRLGNGRQMFPWIHISDMVSAIQFLLTREECQGAFNLCSPGITNNREFTSALAASLKRPSFFSVPAFLLRIFFGASSSILLKGQHMIPHKLNAAGFHFSYNDIDAALKDILKKN